MIFSSLKKFFAALTASLAALAAETEGGGPAPMPVGGQAVIEGVLMKGYTRWGLAVRRADGEIVTEHWPAKNWNKTGWGKIPVVRGFLNMIEMLREGFKALSKSAGISLGEDDEMTPRDVFLTGLVAAVMVIGLFIVLPVYAADWIRRAAGLSAWSGHLIEGCVRGGVFVAYLGMIGLWKDMARVRAYHGAEHKTINAYESRRPMTVESVCRCSRLHPRCGTSFLLIVVIVSIVVFSLAGPGGVVWRVGSRICLIPVVVGVSYEFIRAMSRLGRAGRFVMAPAMSLQYLTTREPGPDQVEVGIRSLEEALDLKFDSDRTEAVR